MKNITIEPTSPPITVRQIKAARALLDWDQEALQEAAGIGLATVRRFEAAGDTALKVQADKRAAIITALVSAGIEFIGPDDGGGIGVRLRYTPGGPKKSKD